MKKLVTLLAAAGMVTAAAAPASAIDTKVDASFRYSFATTQEKWDGNNKEYATQRLRLGLTMAASENLKGYVQFQILGGQMGTAEKNAGTPGSDVSVRQMYIDFKVPATPVKVRMGRQQLGLPADAMGESSIMAAGYGSRDGIVVTAPVTDWLGVTALWNRADYIENGSDLDRNDSDDIYGLVANLKFDGVSAAVYTAYGDFSKGKYTDCAADSPMVAGHAYWFGATSTFTFFDPFTLKLSAAFGEFTADDFDGQNAKAWNVQAKASYKTAYGTPVLGLWYFSGDDKKLGDGTMPNASGAFTPTMLYHDRAKGLNGGAGYEAPLGNWGAQIGVEKVSFLKGLTHDFLITYMEGTNDTDAQEFGKADYMTTEDSLVAFSLSNTYQIYKNLAAHLELEYVICDYEETKDSGKYEDDWAAELTFQYKF